MSGVCVQPSVHSDVAPMTDIIADVHVRPTAHTHTHTRLPAGDVITAQSPPPLLPSLPMPPIDRYLSSDDESITSSLPPAQQDLLPPSVLHRTSVIACIGVHRRDECRCSGPVTLVCGHRPGPAATGRCT